MTSTPETRHRVAPASLVREDGVEVGISAFHDEGVYREELEKIFARCWLFLGHESQLRNPGDYVSARIGEDDSTAVGWAIGVGRIGAILAPIVAGVLVDAGWTGADLFGLFAIPLFLAVLAMIGLKVLKPSRAAEEKDAAAVADLPDARVRDGDPDQGVASSA